MLECVLEYVRMSLFGTYVGQESREVATYTQKTPSQGVFYVVLVNGPSCGAAAISYINVYIDVYTYELQNLSHSFHFVHYSQVRRSI